MASAKNQNIEEFIEMQAVEWLDASKYLDFLAVPKSTEERMLTLRERIELAFDGLIILADNPDL